MQHPAITALAAVFLSALVGCSSIQDPYLTGSTTNLAAASVGGTTEVAPQYALASLAGAGRVIAVRQTLDADSVTQTIVVANQVAIAGENALTVDVGSANSRRFRQAPSRAQLLAEMRTALPGVAMAMTNTIQENAYGIYGYATGRPDAGGSCIYAWQVIDGKSRAATGSAKGASIRLRLCQAGGETEQLAVLMRGLNLKPIDRHIAAAPRLATLSGAVDDTYASESVTETTAIAYQVQEPVKRREAARLGPTTAKTFATITAPKSTPVSDKRPSPTQTATTTKATVNVPMPED